MHARRISIALMALAALVLTGCASAPPQQAAYRHLLGKYDVDAVVMLDHHNQVISTEQLLRTAVEQQFDEKSDAFLKEHPYMTRKDLKAMLDVFLAARLRDQDPLKPMFAALKEKMTEDLDGQPFIALADDSVTTIEPLFLPDGHGTEHGDDLVTATDVAYRLRSTGNTRTLTASGTYQGKPVHLELYLLEHDRVFLDLMPFIKDKLEKSDKAHKLISFGVDKLGVFLTRRDPS